MEHEKPPLVGVSPDPTDHEAELRPLLYVRGFLFRFGAIGSGGGADHHIIIGPSVAVDEDGPGFIGVIFLGTVNGFNAEENGVSSLTFNGNLFDVWFHETPHDESAMLAVSICSLLDVEIIGKYFQIFYGCFCCGFHRA